MKRLIVNADDFGLTPGINAAVVELNEAGVLTSSTLMASGPSFAPAIHLAFVQTTLAIGCHVVLIDGDPVLPARVVPSLIDPRLPASGRFRPTLGAFVSDLLRGHIRTEEIKAEAIAQIRRIQSSGLRVTHIDTHKHVHIFRRVLCPLLHAAEHCGVRAIRNPFEPLWSLRATPAAGVWRKLQVQALRARRAGFLRLTRQAGIATTSGALGVLATGSLNCLALRSMLGAMPDGAWELVCHPGYRDAALEQTRTRLQESREIEQKALLETIPQALANDPDLTLIDFGQLA